MNTYKIAVIPGDGIGPEVLAEGVKTLEAAARLDGSFKFELTTNEARDYDYTLILDKDGYDQRRIRFTITRTMTDAQERSRIKSEADYAAGLQGWG